MKLKKQFNNTSTKNINEHKDDKSQFFLEVSNSKGASPEETVEYKKLCKTFYYIRFKQKCRAI